MTTIKTFILNLALISLCANGYAQESGAKMKIGFFDKDSLLNILDAKEEIDKNLSRVRSEYEKECKRMQQEYNKKIKEYLEKSESMTPVIKRARQSEITDAEKRIALYKERYEAQISHDSDSLWNPVLNKLTDAIKSVATEENLTLVLDKKNALFLSTDCMDIFPLIEKKMKK